MNIKKCPDCARYIHFDGQVGVQKCWNCGLITNFSQHPRTEQRFWCWVDSQLSFGLAPFSNLARWKRCGQFALVAALPAAVLMMLVCNSLQIRIVQDLAAPFYSL